MIDSSEKRNRRFASELQNSHVCEKRSKVSVQSVRPLEQAGSMGSKLSVLVYFWFSYNTIFLSSVNQLSMSHFMLVEGQQFLEFPVTSN